MDLTPTLYSVLEIGFILICVGLWRNGSKKISAHIKADKEAYSVNGVLDETRSNAEDDFSKPTI